MSNSLQRFASVLLGVGLILSLLPSGSVHAQAEGPVYIVQPGDTLITIAVIFGTTVEELAEVNGITNPSLITPGMELVIPGYEGVKGELSVERVEYGETLASLGYQHQITRDSLTRLNRIVNPARIYAGQPLIVPVNNAPESDFSNNQLILPRSGESKLELALRTGMNPWQLDPITENLFKTWVIPGVPVIASVDTPNELTLPYPIVAALVTPSPTTQGRTTTIRIQLSDAGMVEGHLGERALHFQQRSGTEWIALQGIHAMREPGLYDLSFNLFNQDRGTLLFSFSQPIRVLEGGYGFENINGVPPETIDPEVTEPERTMIETLLSEASIEKLWDGAFLFPSNYYTESFVSTFGTRRSYNWGAFDYYHTGLDFYASTGVPIYAPAPGKVVFTGPLIVRGSATYLDHGWGVYSGIFHQSEINVSIGDLVETGQQIGEVGGTGRSTGPHLHWEVWVGGVPVDPLEWVEQDFP